MAQPQWRMVLTPPCSGPLTVLTPIGEILDAHDRKFSFRHKAPSTISFTQHLVSPLATTILALKHGNILLYRDTELMMTAEITSVEASGDSDSHQVTVVATETMWPRLQGVIVGTSGAGQKGPASSTDQGTWLSNILAFYNTFTIAASGAHSSINGVVDNTSASFSGGRWYYKPFMELVQEFSNTLTGFDFWQEPLDPTVTANGGLSGNIHFKNVRGSTRQHAVFEYGVGRHNVASYQYQISNESIANRIYVLPPGFPDSSGLKPVTVTHNGSIGERGYRAAVQDIDLRDETLRGKYADFALDLRRNSREQFTIQPSANLYDGRQPTFGPSSDYGVGDTIRARVEDQGVLMLDALVRIYGVEISVDDDGLETTEMTVIDEAS